ncbi:MAG: hypothetical protein LBL66_04990 [Clostridiales bacterium]|jgi:hypothetical protein|nr:hypothetical protein [Clostridiales bacterium]
MKKLKRILIVFPIILTFVFSGCVNLLDDSQLTDYAKNELGFTDIYATSLVPPQKAREFVDSDIEVESKVTSGAYDTAFLFGRKDGRDTVYFFGKNKSYFHKAKKKDYGLYQDIGNIFIKDFKELEAIAVGYLGAGQEYHYFGVDDSSMADSYPFAIRFIPKTFNEIDKAYDFLCFTDGSVRLYACNIQAGHTLDLLQEIVPSPQ